MRACVFVAVLLAALAAVTTASSSLSCSLHPGGVGERQEVVCTLHKEQPPTTTTSSLLLLLPLPPSIAPDSAWLATAAPAGTGGVVACGDGGDAPAPLGSIGPCPALSDATAAASTLARCVPPAAVTTPSPFHLTARLSAACADEAVAARARPALVVARERAGTFRVALRGRLAAADPRAWVSGPPAVVTLPPPLVAAFHPSNGSAFAGVLARAPPEEPLTWSIPAPGGRGGVAIGAVTAAAAVVATAAMVRAVVVGDGRPRKAFKAR